MPVAAKITVSGQVTPADVVESLQRASRSFGKTGYDRPRFVRLVVAFIATMEDEAMDNRVTRAVLRHCERVRARNRREFGKDWP